MEKYTIRWRGPFTFDEVIEEEGREYSEELSAIVHDPPVRVSRTLYIGRAVGQFIRDRLKRHDTDFAIWKDYGERSVAYHLGRIVLSGGKRISAQRTADIESAIICNHGDELEYNIVNTQTYSGRHVKIRHSGEVPPGIENFSTKNW
ncbi:hypothetical protein ES703_80609 [subsurface metagenome]